MVLDCIAPTPTTINIASSPIGFVGSFSIDFLVLGRWWRDRLGHDYYLAYIISTSGLSDVASGKFR